MQNILKSSDNRRFKTTLWMNQQLNVYRAQATYRSRYPYLASLTRTSYKPTEKLAKAFKHFEKTTMVIPTNINLIYFITIFVCARCIDEKRLKAQYPIYGLSALVDRNSNDHNKCFRQLSEFKDAVDTGKAWGLKG